jgi:hypothetical protein
MDADITKIEVPARLVLCKSNYTICGHCGCKTGIEDHEEDCYLLSEELLSKIEVATYSF